MSKAPAAWLEVALEVDGERAEAVAEVLQRFAPGQVVIESTRIAEDPEGEGYPVGPLRVKAYLPWDETVEERRQQVREALYYLGRILPLPEPTFRRLEVRDWADAWKAYYRPVTIGQRLVIVPAWMENPYPDRVALTLDPGMAFGTGMHPTTQMCLAEVERLTTAGVDVLDIGCGSGILAIAALKLGANRAVGVDTDPEAVRVARENAARNGVAERFVVAQGSVAEVRAGVGPFVEAPLVLANILAGVLVRLLREEGLAATVTPGGYLVLSGILAEQAEEVLAVAEAAGLTLAQRRQMGDWVTLTVRRPA